MKRIVLIVATLTAIGFILELQRSPLFAQESSPRATMLAYAKALKAKKDGAVLYDFVDWKALVSQLPPEQRKSLGIYSPEELKQQYLAGHRRQQANELLTELNHARAQGLSPEERLRLYSEHEELLAAEQLQRDHSMTAIARADISISDVTQQEDSATAVLVTKVDGQTIRQRYSLRRNPYDGRWYIELE